MRLIRPLIGILLSVTTAACSVALPARVVSTSTPDVPAVPTETSAPTITPSPTPTPTPLPAVRVATGDEALFAGDYDRAMEEYQEVLNQNPEGELRSTALLGVGRIHIIRGDYASALEVLRFIVEPQDGSPASAAAYYFLGTVYQALGRYMEAADAFGRYLAIRPGILDDYIQELRGDALTAAGDTQSAYAAYQAAQTALQPGDTSEIDFKLAQNLVDQGDFQGAVALYTQVYDAARNDYTKAKADYLLGQVYLTLGLSDEAIYRFQDAVTNFPRAYDAYSSLVTLVEAGVPVDELSRGLVDYFAGQYGAAINAFDRYIATAAQLDGAPFYYKGLALQANDSPVEAIAQWDVVIANYPEDRFWADAWDEKAYTQWAYLEDYGGAAETQKAFVAAAPGDPKAPDMLYQAGRNLERANRLEEAAATWDQLANDYANTDYGFNGPFLAGITRYRLGDLPNALTSFQRALVLALTPTEQSTAYLWIGKVHLAQKNEAEAQSALQLAAERDPTGYYSERARDLITNRKPFADPGVIDLSYDLNAERTEAEAWMRTTFNIPPETNFSGTGLLDGDSRLARGLEYWRLGLYERGRNELESLRSAVESDPVATYQLMNVLSDLGIYRSAILASRQVLSLAGMDDAATLQAPAFFNHIRFGPYFKQLILEAAQRDELSPLILFSLIRQESMFEGFAISSAGARGLMQVMPETGASIVTNMGWPPDYTADDLYRPYVSIRLGSRYLAQQLELFDGDIYAALAAYNGGPGNALAWKELASDDPDLFLETVRIQQTRDYIMRIYEIFTIYRRIYGRTL